MSEQKNRPPQGAPMGKPGAGGPSRGGRPGSGGGHGPMGGMMGPKEKPKDMKKVISRLMKYIGRNRYLFFLLLAVMIGSTLLGLAGPALQGKAIDAMTLTEGRLEVDFDSLTRTLVIMSVIYCATSLLTYVQGITAAKLSQATVQVMRGDLFNKIVHLPIRYLDTHPHGDIMSRMTNDVENISNTVANSVASLISGMLTLVGTLAIMLWYSPLLTLVSMVSIVLSVLATVFVSKFTRRYFMKQQTLLGDLNGQVEEMVTGYHTVVAFSREEQAITDFNKTNSDLCQTAIWADIYGGSMGPLMTIIGNIGFLLICVVGGSFAIKGAITIGVIQAFILYAKQLSRPIAEIANLYGSIQTALAGAERVFSILDEENEQSGDTKPLAMDKVSGEIRFEDVDFSYVPEEPVIRDFNLTVNPGERVAIVGATGSGKTTLVNLITRLYDVDKGTLYLDGRDIRSMDRKELRSCIAIVLQDTVLFSDTIANNIRYGKLDAAEDDLVKAAETANADEFIRLLPKEYETMLSESGSNLSQGQRQLLSISRAVLANPKILILDEATSSVDTRTEMHIQQAMQNLMRGRTCVIIAHRLSTIRDADKIVVLDHGRLVEMGSHEGLLAQKGTYWQLYQRQFAGNET